MPLFFFFRVLLHVIQSRLGKILCMKMSDPPASMALCFLNTRSPVIPLLVVFLLWCPSCVPSYGIYGVLVGGMSSPMRLDYSAGIVLITEEFVCRTRRLSWCCWTSHLA